MDQVANSLHRSYIERRLLTGSVHNEIGDNNGNDRI